MQTQWSKIKKKLEESICEALKNRVSYFATSYRHAHDGQCRVCILVDKKEIINMAFTNDGKWFEEYSKVQAEGYIRKELIRKTDGNLAERGIFTTCIFAEAYNDFCTKSIEECLTSDNHISRLIAFIDKRTGRRTLEKMKDSVVELPEWLQYFYNLRVAPTINSLNK